ncbi:polysaccharide deacetylase family protein [Anaerosphaera multitolerans]|uniref:Polysaccharide deacetylase family protein n=1 Tax=Anaerosphaera multitolerans TaxID=2487351 RepID=A0A437S6Z8_9FIRM|nr:polysaccharide deacetylase family protein [Anaerosphaera multitolerans]RVU54809.1 polysaccharide deacetylase family protein [Anaerosphaera multitolerans]
MSTKKFFTMFVLIVLIIFIPILLLNVLVDPFGLFGDKIYKWDSYNFTQNPRTAKIEYINKHKDKFNSYIVGSSGCGSIQVDTLNNYTADSYYNAFYYGSDLMDSYNTIKYLSENTEVENILLGINYNTAMFFDIGDDEINQRMHGKAVGKNLLNFYTTYLFANPRYALAKINDAKEDSFFQKSFDVFLPETGVYDKSTRDVENIGNFEDYVAKENYSVFNNYPREEKKLVELGSFKNCMTDIKKLCDNSGINLEVVVFPIYWEDFDNYDVEELETFYRELANITDFWDFSKSKISTDARYFYDSTHFRNSVGDMMLAKIYNDSEVYMPNDFGHHVDSGNVESFLRDFKSYELKFDDYDYTVEVPVILLHSIDDGEYSISKEQFERQIRLIKESGYNTVSLKDLYDYTEKGVELPDNPILITFDDGYTSNYEVAYPLFKELNMKSTIYLIGSSLGKDTYKETGEEIIPHFDSSEAVEMWESGLIDIQSHSYDMHQSEKFEENSPVRKSVQRFEGESEDEYIKAFKDDFEKESIIIEEITKEPIHSFSYPTGYYSEETEVLLGLLGVKSTLTIDEGKNTIIKGLPQSLFKLKRINIYRDMPDENLLNALK